MERVATVSQPPANSFRRWKRPSLPAAFTSWWYRSITARIRACLWTNSAAGRRTLNRADDAQDDTGGSTRGFARGINDYMFERSDNRDHHRLHARGMIHDPSHSRILRFISLGSDG